MKIDFDGWLLKLEIKLKLSLHIWESSQDSSYLSAEYCHMKVKYKLTKSSRTLLKVPVQVSLCGSTWSCLVILRYLTNITSRRPTKINYRSTIDAILHNLADRRFPAHKVLRKSRKIAKTRRSKQKIILKCKSLGLESHPSHRTIIILSVLVSPRFLAVQLFIFCFAAFSSPPCPEKRAVCDSDARRFAWSQKAIQK